MPTGKPPFERVVREHGPTVLRVCRAVLNGDTEADDAWSETFLAALRAWPRLPAEANVEAWLVTIAHRKAIDIVRRRRTAPLAAGTIPEPVSATPASEPDHGDLWSAVRALPDKQRLSLAYHHLGGLSYREVAELLGGTDTAARRAAADGMRRLRDQLRNPDRPAGSDPQTTVIDTARQQGRNRKEEGR